MIRPAVALQSRGETFCFVADLHALTTVRAPTDLRRWSREVALDLLAAGLDPTRTVLFRQSEVPEVTALAWILSVVTPFGLLERAHAYKDKVARGQPASLGLFAYPVLMAADILLYDADLVPVGRDQTQHIEITRDIAGKLNDAYGPVFKLPQASIQDDVAVVPGTDGQKMSKSYGNTIELGLAGDALRKRVMDIVTDSASVADRKEPSGSTIVALYRLVASEADTRQMEQELRSGGASYSKLKGRLREAIESYFGPFRSKRDALAREPEVVDRVLRNGAERARTVAMQTLARVRQAVGID